MRNIFINNYRRTVRERTVIEGTEDLYQLNFQQPTNSTPEGTYAVNEISHIIDSFSEDYRKPFSMYVAGYKYEEIAEILDIPLGTVKSRIFTTRQKLRSILKDYR